MRRGGVRGGGWWVRGVGGGGWGGHGGWEWRIEAFVKIQKKKLGGGGGRGGRVGGGGRVWGGGVRVGVNGEVKLL